MRPIFALLSVLAFGCRHSFPSCENDAQCAGQTAGAPYCVSHTCVSCRYDTDCKGGRCSDRNRCER